MEGSEIGLKYKGLLQNSIKLIQLYSFHKERLEALLNLVLSL